MSDTLFAYQSFRSPTGPTALWDIEAQVLRTWRSAWTAGRLVPRVPAARRLDDVVPGPEPERSVRARSFSASPLTTSVEFSDPTRRRVAGPISVDGSHEAVALSGDGTLLAVSVVSPDQAASTSS